MNSMIDIFMSSMMNLQLKVLSINTDIKSCQSECSGFEGHLPYFFEGQSQSSLTKTVKGDNSRLQFHEKFSLKTIFEIEYY